MRKNHRDSSSDGVVKTLAYFAVIALIIVKVLRSVLTTLTDVVANVQTSRQSRR